MISVSFCTAIRNPNFSKTIWTMDYIMNKSLNFEPKTSMKESRMTIVSKSTLITLAQSSCAAFWNVPSRTGLSENKGSLTTADCSSKLIRKKSLKSHPKAENY